jgi:hypothetical protein
MISSFISSVQSFVQSFVQSYIAVTGILAVLSILVIVGLLAGLYQEAKLRKAEQRRRWPRATSEVEEDDPAARS